MNDLQCPVVELRQYTLHPGRRDEFIEFFDREFVEIQEAVGMAILGQFRGLDDPDRFVWLRGFDDLPHRARALGRFDGGPLWKAHKDQANATMIDSDGVLLLRPGRRATAFRPAGRMAPHRPHRIATAAPARDAVLPRPRVRRGVRGLLRPPATPGPGQREPRRRRACRPSTPRPSFPALPVRTGENVFVWFARFPSPAPQRPPALAGALGPLAAVGASQLVAVVTSVPQQLG